MDFSWNSKGGEMVIRVFSKIDHCFGNLPWMDLFTEVVVNYMQESLSDHTPLVLRLDEPDSGGTRPFRFFNYMAEHDQFL